MAKAHPFKAKLRHPDEHAYEARLQSIRRLCDRWGAFYCGDTVQPDRPVYRCKLKPRPHDAPAPLRFQFKANRRPDLHVDLEPDERARLFLDGTVTAAGYVLKLEAWAQEIVIAGASTELPTELEDPGPEQPEYEALLSRRIDRSAKIKVAQTLTFRDGARSPVQVILRDEDMRRLLDGDRLSHGGAELFCEGSVVYCAIVHKVTARGKQTRSRPKRHQEVPAEIEQLDQVIKVLPAYLVKLLKFQHLRRNWAREHRHSRAACSKVKFNSRLREAYAAIMIKIENS